MVTTTLIGRLGNQMFQIAAAIGYARTYGMDYCIPEKSLDENIWKKYFYFPVQEFEAKKVYKERFHFYVRIPKYPSVRLEGFFQTEKYFEHCKKEVIDTFGFESSIMKGWVSIHVRRGDYVTMPDYFPPLPIEYYKKAVEYFTDNGYSLFLIFSDDIEWCKQVFIPFSKNFPKADFDYSEKPELEDLKLMSRCEHNIIANSSFSWWGAWMNQNCGKKVIAPDKSKWFGRKNRHLNTRDVIPKEWMQIKF